MKTGPRALLLAPCLFLLACDYSSGTTGELANGEFHYECVAYGDPVCDGPTGAGLYDDFIGEPSNTPVPSSIAVGAAFEVEFYEPEDDSGERLIRRPVSSASPLLLDEAAVGFVGLRPGWVALIARDGRGRVADLVHVRIAEPFGIQLSGYVGETMPVGSQRNLHVEVFDGNQNQLGGALRIEWEVDDESVARVLPAYDATFEALFDDHVILEAVTAGTTTVRASTGEMEIAVDVTVSADGGSE